MEDDKLPNMEDTNVEISKKSEGIVPDVLTKSEVDDEDDDEDSHDSVDEDVDDDEDKTKVEETAQLLNKTRVLPSWMAKNKG